MARTKEKSIQVYLGNEMRERLAQTAKREHRSMTNLVTWIVLEWLKERSPAD